MPSAPRPTIYDVAEHAGVSISTVSLAINHPDRVSAETRRRIARSAEQLGYRSRADARSARAARSSIAVAAPFSSWPSYAERLSGLLARTSGTGIELIVHDLPSTHTRAAPLLDALPVRADLQGVVLMGTPLSDDVETALLRARLPAVIVDAESDRLPSVQFDDQASGRLIGDHLVSLGHRRVVFAHEGQASFDYVSAGQRRYEGVRSALTAADGDMVTVGVDDGLVSTVERAGATAVVASNDTVAAQALRLLRAAGIGVPDTVSVSGFDGGAVADALELTTVVSPFHASGEAAGDLLIALLDGRAPAVRRIVLGGELRAGATTAPASPHRT